MRRARRNADGGFTLIELVIAITIMGVILVPIANFVLGYFRNLAETQARLGDSHDAQIVSAYLSQDVANTGLRNGSNVPQQSIWTTATGFPGTYCGSTLGGSPVLLLAWDDWSASGGTGTDTPDSVLYAVRNGALHRSSCNAGGTPVDSTVAHELNPNLASPVTVACSTAGVSGSCGSATPPTTVTLTLSLQTTGDSAPWAVSLSGQRRQASS